MNAKIQAVFFDWAGTMVDFGSRAPVIAMQSVFKAAGVPVSEEVVRAHMGKAKREHVLAIFEDDDVNALWETVKGHPPQGADADDLMIGLEPAMAQAAANASALIPGAKAVFDALIESGIKVGSSTGYTQTMMKDVARLAREQGYAPQTLLCAGDTPQGRPAPFMLWQGMINLGVWPARACVAVDDAPVGILAGREAGMWTVGLSGSGNEVGLDYESYNALPSAERADALARAEQAFATVRADFVIESVADLPPVLAEIEQRLAAGQSPNGSANLGS